VPYPQYWSHRLTGAIASEITSLGCHTDLWNFDTGLFSSLVLKQGWLDRMPEVRPASDILGVVRPEIAARLGFTRAIPVSSGIHDSNASLLPHLLDRQPPFGLISTGTWVITAAPGGDSSALDPARDCLANLDVFGRPVPSSRFMGGREFEMMTSPRTPSPEAVRRVLGDAVALTPSVVMGSGPFPGRRARWSVPEAELGEDDVYVGTSFYLAMMTAQCLELAGAEGPIVVEGPFAGNALFLEMLASAAGRQVEAVRRSATGTSIGAALLARMEAGPPGAPLLVEPSAAMIAYAALWRQAVAGSVTA
jgi:sugar (pentulose or hexulose) kinase